MNKRSVNSARGHTALTLILWALNSSAAFWNESTNGTYRCTVTIVLPGVPFPSAAHAA